jgi:hypothetical protein
MKVQVLLLATLLPLACQAQIALFAENGTTETPIGQNFDIGKVAIGTTLQVIFRARNTGSTSVQVSPATLSGAGFTLINPPLHAMTLAPQDSQDFTLQLVAGGTGTYNAFFQLNSLSVLVLAESVYSLSSGAGCTIPDPASGNIAFATVTSSVATTCTLTLRNPSTQAVTLSHVTTAGTGFGSPQGISSPLTIPPGGSASFTISFAPGIPGVYSGTLTIDAHIYTLSATAVSPVLPAPVFSFDAGAFQSAQQRNVTLSLPAASPVEANGNLTIAFTPDATLVPDDPSVNFAATGARSVPFTVHQGSTQVLLNGQSSAVFQTGTTSGKINFYVSSNVAFQSASTAAVTIPPAKVSVDNSRGSSLSGSVVLQITGYDNTYSAGPMSFVFYDTGGRALNQGSLSADFTTGFRTYFSKAQAGGMFQAAITFPVNGDVTQVGAVDVQITNSAGSTMLQRIAIPACQLNGLTCVPN